jgi:CAAX protease family protein
MQNVTPAAVIAFMMELAPAVAFGFTAERIARSIQRRPVAIRLIFPSVCVLPYVLLSLSAHIFRWRWFALYLSLPVVIASLLEQAAAADPEQRGNWRDAIILLALGLSVDLRWFDGAWPNGLQALNKLLLVDMGLYGFLAVRQLSRVGFDFCFRWSDWKTGLRELIFFTPLVLTLGLALGFIHPHANRPHVSAAILRWLLIFLFTALPEELFFRGWVQNLLERRLNRRPALLITSALFGLSHFNKRAAHFNWRYVLLAAIAGIFYGRAWREQRRVAASTITHASVDWIWGLWF